MNSKKGLIIEYQLDPQEEMGIHKYGTGNLVETMLYMLNARFGEGLKSRGTRERKRELLFEVV